MGSFVSLIKLSQQGVFLALELLSSSSYGDCGADCVLSWWVLSCSPKLAHHKMLHQREVLLEVTVMSSVSQPD